MPKPRIDLIVKGNAVMHDHKVEDISDISSTYLKLDASNDPVTGSLTIQPLVDSLTAFVINDKDNNNVLTVDTINNNVGLGTSTPTQALHLYKSSGISTIIAETGGSANDEFRIDTKFTASANTTSRIGSIRNNRSISGDTSMYFSVFGGSLKEAMRIRDDGNVGIGTTNPTAKFHLAGTTTSDYAQIDTGLNFDQVDTGVAATTFLETVAGNVDAGTHYYGYTFTTTLGETSMRRDVSTLITADATHGRVTVTIPVSADYRVTGRKIYRSKANQAYGSFYLLDTITNNVSTTYLDNKADSSLGAVDNYRLANTTNSLIKVNNTPSLAIDTFGTNLGIGAGGSNMSLGGWGNTNIGNLAGGILTSGYQNTLIGDGVGSSIVGGSRNTFVGSTTGLRWTGSSNVLMGSYVGYANVSAITGNNNVMLGSYIAYNSPTGAWGSNTILGDAAGYNLAGSSNVFIGKSAGYYETGSNKLIIDNAARTDEATARTNSMFYGVFNTTVASQTLAINAGTINLNGNVGIGTTNPGKKLEIYNVGDTTDTAIKITSGSWFNTITNEGSDGNLVIAADQNQGIRFKNGNGGNTDVMFISSTGYIGIGTTTPNDKLDVFGIIRASSTTALYTQLGNNYIRSNGTQNFFVDNSGTGVDTYFRVSNAGSLDTISMILKSTGKVGIGTTTPTASLDVGGFGTVLSGTVAKMLVADNYDGVSGLQMYNSSTGTSADFRFTVADQSKSNYISFMMPSKNNTVGNLFGAARSTSAYIFTNNLAAEADRNLTIGTFNAKDLILGTNNTDRIHITSTGNIGIGTTTPYRQIEVNGGSLTVLRIAGNDAILELRDLSSDDQWSIQNTDNVTRNLRFRYGAGLASNSYSTTDIMTLASSGNVGIGTTTPAAKLHIVGTTDNQQLIVKANATQTTNLMEWQNSSGTVWNSFGLTGAVFNESGDASTDFRVESDTEANMIFMDANANTDGTLYVGGNSVTTAHTTRKGGVFFPVQAATASAPAYVQGGMYFDTTLNKLRIGGAAGWETVASV